MSLLRVKDLQIRYHTEVGQVHAAENVSFDLEKNQTFGLVGESGSGKTTVAKAINGILAENGEITGGSILFDGQDLTDLSKKEIRKIRWEEISMIPQSAMNALDPVYTVGEQMVEVMQVHRDVSKEKALERSKELFELVNLDPNRIDNYPHQFSGGMKQRVMIALSLLLEPSIILADEPTTALDVIVQHQIIRELEKLQEELGFTILLITHDISVVASISDQIGVMYEGRLVEQGPTRKVMREPEHPYTMGLRNAFPSIDKDTQILQSIPGSPSDLIDPVDECRFASRCPFAIEDCLAYHPPPTGNSGHKVECVRSSEAETLRERADNYDTWVSDDIVNINKKHD